MSRYVTQVSLGSLLLPASGYDPQSGLAASEWCCHAGPLFASRIIPPRYLVTQSAHHKLDMSTCLYHPAQNLRRGACSNSHTFASTTGTSTSSSHRCSRDLQSALGRPGSVLELRWSPWTPDNSGRRGSLPFCSPRRHFGCAGHSGQLAGSGLGTCSPAAAEHPARMLRSSCLLGQLNHCTPAALVISA